MGRRTGGKANRFQRDFLEANLIGTQFRGSEVTSVSNKYIHTKDASHDKRGLDVSFEIKEHTLSMIRDNSQGDTEGDRL